MKDTGTENYGGPVVTAGGLVFIAATNFDRKFRAFDKQTGKLLWEATLPFASNATPATYEVGGRQFVVVYATGGKGKSTDPTGGAYVAFALPAETRSPQIARGMPIAYAGSPTGSCNTGETSITTVFAISAGATRTGVCAHS